MDSKELILVSNSPEFYVNHDPVIDLIERFQNRKLSKNDFDKLLFNLLDRSIINHVNPKYSKFSKSNKIKFINIFYIMCSESKKTCLSFDEYSNKIYLDYGHRTVSGSRYIGKLIYKNKIFVNILN